MEKIGLRYRVINLDWPSPEMVRLSLVIEKAILDVEQSAKTVDESDAERKLLLDKIDKLSGGENVPIESLPPEMRFIMGGNMAQQMLNIMNIVSKPKKNEPQKCVLDLTYDEYDRLEKPSVNSTITLSIMLEVR